MRQGESRGRKGSSFRLHRGFAMTAFAGLIAGMSICATAQDGQDAVPGAPSTDVPAEAAPRAVTMAAITPAMQAAQPEQLEQTQVIASVPSAIQMASAPSTLIEAPAAPLAAIPANAVIQASVPVETVAPAPHGGSTGILGLHSDLTFSVLSAPRKALDDAAQADAEALAFAEQVKRISASLQVAAQGLYAERVRRIGAFDVYVAGTDEPGAMSSGTGKIAVNAGLAKLKPTDDWLAFVIAREMGHVVSGHHDSNAGASLAVSIIMNIIIPGSGLIKSAISFAGSQMASESGRDKQVREADEAALKLLEAAGYTAKAVALNLRLSPLAESAGSSRWATSFRASSLHLVASVQGPQAVQAVQVVGTPVAPVGVAPLLQGQPVQVQPMLVQSAAPAPVNATPARWQPEELVRTRPSGLPGPLISGGFAMPVRRIE